MVIQVNAGKQCCNGKIWLKTANDRRSSVRILIVGIWLHKLLYGSSHNLAASPTPLSPSRIYTRPWWLRRLLILNHLLKAGKNVGFNLGWKSPWRKASTSALRNPRQRLAFRQGAKGHSSMLSKLYPDQPDQMVDQIIFMEF